MQQIFTLILGLVLLCPRAKAQYSQDFEKPNVLGINCLDQTQFITTIGSGLPPIHGKGSAYTNPPTSGSELRTLTTPFLMVTEEPLTISFYYQLSSKLAGQATRIIEVGLLDRNGAFNRLARIDVARDADEAAQFFNRTFNRVTPGVYRVEFRITGNTGDGNSRMIYDDLYVSASPYYGPVVNCNSAPVAVSDSYASLTLAPLTGNVLTDGPVADSDPNGEALTATITSQPDAALGTIQFNPDGTFTFTPAPGFTGGDVTFTYRVTDNGYPATSSNIATVTISYPVLSTLPIHLTAFKGKLVKEKAELSWSVATNETAALFVVERSADGKHFTPAGSVAATEKSGDENYRFTDPLPVGGKVIYRLQMTDREGKEEYSRSILLQAGSSVDAEIRVMSSPGVKDLKFMYKTAHDAMVSIRVYNTTGQLLHARRSVVHSGVNQLEAGCSLPAGAVYILEVVSSEGARSVVKFRK